MKKILMILAIVIFLGAAGTTFISLNLNASGPSTDPKPPIVTDPHSHHGTATLCYNIETTACG